MREQNLSVPSGKIDMVLDTDAYNEVDDQFAIAYALFSKEKLNVKAFFAAPFLNGKSVSPKDGMEKSYNEILKLLSLINVSVPVYKGSERYLDNETTPVISEAAQKICELSKNYSEEKPLYVVAIGAITNVASALLMHPEIKDKIVVVWLGGHSRDYSDTKEFNMQQDIAATRVVMESGVAFVQLPCYGVVDVFRVSSLEYREFFKGKNQLCDYLVSVVEQEVSTYVESEIWTRVVWDVTAVAWLLNDGERFMKQRVEDVVLPGYDFKYAEKLEGKKMTYVYRIKRDPLLIDLVKKLTGKEI